jgi:uncharacterized cupin superfamily protein
LQSASELLLLCSPGTQSPEKLVDVAVADHDHPFEKSYFLLEGEVDVVADDNRYTLRPGDVPR